MKNTNKNIFEFSHIDKSLSECDIETLKDFYKHYHKKYWCFKKSYKRYKLLDETVLLSGISLVAMRTIAGGITLNTVVLGVENGAGGCCGWYWKEKTLQKKNRTKSNRVYNI